MKRHLFDGQEVLTAELECRKAIFDLFAGGPKKRTQALMRLFPGPLVNLDQFAETLRPHLPPFVFSQYQGRNELFVKILSTTLTDWDSSQVIPVSQFADRWMRREYSRHTTKRWREPDVAKKTKRPKVGSHSAQERTGRQEFDQNPEPLPVIGEALGIGLPISSQYDQDMFNLQVELEAKCFPVPQPLNAEPAELSTGAESCGVPEFSLRGPVFPLPVPGGPLSPMDWSPRLLRDLSPRRLDLPMQNEENNINFIPNYSPFAAPFGARVQKTPSPPKPEELFPDFSLMASAEQWI